MLSIWNYERKFDNLINRIFHIYGVFNRLKKKKRFYVQLYIFFMYVYRFLRQLWTLEVIRNN